MSKAMRVCLCLGAMLGMAGVVDTVRAQDDVGQPVVINPPGGGTWPYCGAWKNCANNNVPGGPCTFSNGNSYYVCSTVSFPSTCQPGNSFWWDTCSGIDQNGNDCSVWFNRCTA
jgi:hypothetical protein